jgi:hypothetical protein
MLWVNEVRDEYRDLLDAMALEFDDRGRAEGVILQETATGLGSNAPSGYTPVKYRDALRSIYTRCSFQFDNSWCVPFMNYIPGNLDLMRPLADYLAALPNGNACLAGPDIIPSDGGLFISEDRIYHILVDYDGCRANSMQNESYRMDNGPADGNDPDHAITPNLTRCVDAEPGVPCPMWEMFLFGVRGSAGEFNKDKPFDSGLCINSFIFWNHKTWKAAPWELTFDNAANVIANNPYGDGWPRASCEP